MATHPVISVVPSIVKVFVKKIALWISIRANDWTADGAIITGNEKVSRKKTSSLFIAKKFLCQRYVIICVQSIQKTGKKFYSHKRA